MRTKLQKINEGFTIVEVLIVLAIAALILVIILIAVPDLQRSSRNTNIFHDAQNVASAIQTYEGNNSGSVPTAASGPATGIETIGAAGTAQSTAHVQGSDSIPVKTVASGGNTGNVTWGAFFGQGEVLIALNAFCDGSTSGPATGSTLNGNYSNRSVAVYYPIETASGGNVGCIQE